MAASGTRIQIYSVALYLLYLGDMMRQSKCKRHLRRNLAEMKWMKEKVASFANIVANNAGIAESLFFKKGLETINKIFHVILSSDNENGHKTEMLLHVHLDIRNKIEHCQSSQCCNVGCPQLKKKHDGNNLKRTRL